MMYKEQLNTPVAGEYDVIVAGAGPAGVTAAIAAGRAGMKTLLLDQCGCLGGMWTSGLVNPLFDFRRKQGIIREIVDTLAEKSQFGGFGNSCFQYEYMKCLLDDMVKDAGVDVLLNTFVARAIAEEGTVRGVVTENKDGRRAYFSEVVIDCTGDADIAESAGAECLVGRAGDGAVQAITLMFTIGNVHYKQNDCNQLYNLFLDAMAKTGAHYDCPYERPYIIQIPNSNTAAVQLTHVRGADVLSAKALSDALSEGRRQAIMAVEFMKANIPEFKDIELLQTAPLMGVRESRRIVGEYTLTAEDLIAGKQFEDGLFDALFNMDVHEPDSRGQNCTHLTKPYQVPYRCLIPKHIKNLLVAGRCISGTHEAMASYRVTGSCSAMGEAAGYAAAEAVRQNKDLRLVSVEEIKKNQKRYDKHLDNPKFV